GEGEPVEGEGESVDTIAEELLEEFEARDGDNDGSLTLEESGLTTGQFSALDTDSNGSLSRNELIAAASPDGLAAVPNVVGLSREAAHTAILSAGLKPGSGSLAFDDTVPEDHIISQSPAAEMRIALNSGVDLVISEGPEYPEDKGCGCFCNNSETEDTKAMLRKVFGDWLLIGIAMLGLYCWKFV
ncbi:MAG: PASTA domain-containing protein, partial [Candidatus Hydrogenedentes bacterium]|nr:PASTA domain-containing protein [Candidatus Hydrogenedentota bacterium]